jgi:hypothetical protein
MPSYTLNGLRTRCPVIWGGQNADAWFRGGPGVREVTSEPTCTGSPIEAAYAVATDPINWADAEKIAGALGDYLHAVAFAALRGNRRATEIAAAVIVGWNCVQDGGDLALRVLYERFADVEAEWRYEIKRRRDFRSLEALGRAIEPLRAVPGLSKAGWHALVYWDNNQPPLPVRVPFLHADNPEQLLREGAYRLAIAQIIAERRGYRIPLSCHPCADVLATCTLSADERRLLEWGCVPYSSASAPSCEPAVHQRAGEIAREIRQRIWPHA